MKSKTFLITTIYALITTISPAASAWGPEGHRIIGKAAVSMLDETALAAVSEILGSETATEAADAMDEVCNWPDEVRESPKWEWTAPFHYVNIPRSVDHYDRPRDCPDTMCVTEGIKRFANELTQPGRNDRQRWQALAWVCHLVGDLHQPLHAGYRDDRGGNQVTIKYLGEEWNLHEFWDGVLIRERLADEEAWVRRLSDKPDTFLQCSWNPDEVIAWTDESHAMADEFSYPATSDIEQAFADQSWQVIGGQWQKAADRLAQILNAVLGEGDVEIKDPGRS